MQAQWNLYRRRYLPDEIVHLKDDIILYQDEHKIITSWDTLKPRKDIKRGISAYFMDEGFKVSKIFNANNELVYWYCDIIDTEKTENSLIFHDLLVDIIIYPDNSMLVADLDELGLLLKEGKINADFVSKSLDLTNHLIFLIHAGAFTKYQEIINEFDRL